MQILTGKGPIIFLSNELADCNNIFNIFKTLPVASCFSFQDENELT